MQVIINVFKWLWVNKNEILGILLAGLLLICQFIFSSDWNSIYPTYAKVVIIVAFIVYVATQIRSIKDNVDKREMENEIKNWRKESSILIDEHMKLLSDKLSFNRDNHHYISRVSLYKKNKKGFFCVSRRSNSEDFRNKSQNLYKYKGVISESWDKGNREGKGYFDNSIPDPLVDLEEYKKYHRDKYKMRNGDLKDLRMKSLLYFGWRLNDSQGIPIGVLLFESTERDKFSEDELNQIFSSIGDFEHIARFTLPNLPSPYYDESKKL